MYLDVYLTVGEIDKMKKTDNFKYALNSIDMLNHDTEFWELTNCILIITGIYWKIVTGLIWMSYIIMCWSQIKASIRLLATIFFL